MINTHNVGTVYFEPWEWILVPGLIVIIYFVGARYKAKNIGRNPEYKYFLSGLMFKVFAGIFFGIIYIFYYGGGDTIYYYSSTIPLANLFWHNPSDYFNILLHSNEITANFTFDEWEAFTFNVFDHNTGIPLSFMSRDPKTFMVCKLTSPILILTNKSYFATTIILSAITYIPMWHIYRMFLSYFPQIDPWKFAIATLFMPSVAFWGSGIMKDTYSFAATLFAVLFFFKLVKKKQILAITIFNIFILLVSFFIIISIKPYILNILIPALGLWSMILIVRKVENVIFKFVVLPMLFIVTVIGSYSALSFLGNSMDKFSIDNAIETTMITQEDLKREEQYGENSFDIGQIDGTIPNLLSKLPAASFAGLFRPLIIEARNPLMILSGLENLYLIGLLILALVKIKLKFIISGIRQNPIIIFCLFFSIMFAFMIGITTPNFGALVRFKIPLSPFFTAALTFIFYNRPELSDNGT